MSNEDLARGEIDDYLGKRFSKIVRMLSPEDWAKFNALGIDVAERKSYIIEGSKVSLRKFEAFYLFQCSFAKPLVARYMLTDYIHALLSGNEDDYIEKDVMFFYSHCESFGIGNTETLYMTTILEKIATRVRRGGISVIFSERTLPLLEKSEELITIKLDDTIRDVKPFMPAPKLIVQKAYQPSNNSSAPKNTKKRKKDEIEDVSNGWQEENDDSDERNKRTLDQTPQSQKVQEFMNKRNKEEK